MTETQLQTPQPQQRRLSRRSISKQPPAASADNVEPLDRLKAILHPEFQDLLPTDPEIETQKEVPELEDVFDKGKSLEEIRFLLTQAETPAEYEKELKQLLDFQLTVDELDKTLHPLSEFLSGFNSHLVELSKELESLKARSLTLSQNLTKRTELEGKYTPIVSDLIIPPSVIKSIYNGEINPKWCENLHFLSDKSQIFTKYTNDEQFSQMPSLSKLTTLLDLLHRKALERIRNYIVSSIKKLRVIGTASQVVQQSLINVKEIYIFLNTHNPSLALELRQAYTYTMRWYYQAHFHRYLHSLEKLKVYSYTDKSTLIGGTASQGFFKRATNTTSSSSSTQPTGDYSIGKRAQIVKAEDPTVMLAQIAEHNQVSFNMEVGFRSFNLALLDNGSVEYLFLTEFFKMGGEANALFEQIFDPVYKMGSAYTKLLIGNTFDVFGCLIMIRLSQSLIFELQKRRIPVIEDYFNLQMILLWPRFQQLIDLNCESMKRASTKSSYIADIKTNSPHPLTVQFTNLLYGFFMLTKYDEHSQTHQEPLYNSVQRLRNDYESIMTKMSKSSKQAEVFLYTNYSYVLGVLTECEGNPAQGETEHFQLLVDAFQPN